MTARQYARLSAPFRQPARRKALLAANKAATWGCYLAYPLLLLVLALQRDGRFFRSLLVPAVSFAVLSLVRRALNFRRPYQVLDIDPIIHKGRQGKIHAQPARLFHLCHRHDLSLDRAVAGRRPARPRRGAGLRARHRRRPLSKGRPRRCGRRDPGRCHWILCALKRKPPSAFRRRWFLHFIRRNRHSACHSEGAPATEES